MLSSSSSTCGACGATNQPQAKFCHICGFAIQPVVAASMFNSATGQLVSNVLLKQRYRILYPVGQGGMGAVYAAEDTQLGNRKVALKEMRQSGLSPQEVTDAANAFRQEALMLAALQNPHLPNIYDHFNEFGRWYLVMSFISGETLEDYLDKASGNKLPLDEALQIGIQLCSVLGYLHTQQLNLDENKRPTSIAEVKRKLQSIVATPAKAAHVPPTIPAPPPSVVPPKPPVQRASPPVAPKPSVQRASPFVTPAAAKQMSAWSIGKRQISTMFIGFVMFGIADYTYRTVLLSNVANPRLTSYIIFNITLAGLLFALTLVVPLFFSLKFGPWVGLVSFVMGALAGDYLSKDTPFVVILISAKMLDNLIAIYYTRLCPNGKIPRRCHHANVAYLNFCIMERLVDREA